MSKRREQTKRTKQAGKIDRTTRIEQKASTKEQGEKMMSRKEVRGRRT